MTEPSRTPLHDKLEAMGGTFEEDSGWLWIDTFGDITKEYNALGVVKNGRSRSSC